MNAFAIKCGLTGDAAEAETFEAALVAAAALVDDAFDAVPVQGRTKAARRSLLIIRDGMYDGAATSLARAGLRRRLSDEWGR